MNIKRIETKENNLHKLFESQQETKITQQNIVDEKVTNTLSDILKIKSKQFTFENGLIMGTINSGLNNINFGLGFHVLNTKDEDSFIDSVKSFLSATEAKLTVNDEEKLRNHYRKHANKLLK